jgi:hypothetical protein
MPINPGRSNGHQFNAISLFSGGLDSMIGAIDILEKGRIPLFVSHAGDPATSNAQNLCFDVLRQHYSSRPINRFRVWLNFPTGLVHGVFPENTTRARSFLFISLGVLAATGLEGVVTLSVPENGFIALNVPLDLLRLGSYSTRTTHPFYLARWNDLSNILGVPVRIDNPYWLKTKGEMITECANSDLIGRALLGTLSCSSPSKGRWQGHGIEHCGYCLPCLVRRAAIKKALGRKTDPTTYSVRNLSVHVLDTLKSQGQQVRSFQLALAKLHAKPEIAGLIIHKPGTLSDVDPARLRDLAEVYSRGLEEVGALLSDVKAHPL